MVPNPSPDITHMLCKYLKQVASGTGVPTVMSGKGGEWLHGMGCLGSCHLYVAIWCNMMHFQVATMHDVCISFHGSLRQLQKMRMDGVWKLWWYEDSGVYFAEGFMKRSSDWKHYHCQCYYCCCCCLLLLLLLLLLFLLLLLLLLAVPSVWFQSTSWPQGRPHTMEACGGFNAFTTSLELTVKYKQ